MKNWIIAVLVGIVAIGGGAFAFAQSTNTATVEVTVWRSVSNPELLYLSTRPEGGRWTTHNEALDMSQLSSSGRFYQSNAIEVEVPLPESVSPSTPTTPESTPTTGFGAWEYYTGANALGEIAAYYVSGESRNTNSWDSPSLLFVQCYSSGSSRVSVMTRELLINDYNTGGINVVYRFSGGTPIVDKWLSNEDSDGVLVASSKFETDLRHGAGTLYIEAVDTYSDTYAASFQVDGVAQVFNELPCLSSTTRFGSWEYFTAANADGELEGYRVEGESPDDYSPTLLVRCASSGLAEIYVTTREQLFNDSDTDRLSVTYRFSGGTSVTEQWWSDEESRSFLWAFATFATNLRNGAGTLYIFAVDSFGDRYSASFPIDGVGNVFAALPCF